MTLTKKFLLAFAVKLTIFLALLAVSYITIERMLVAREWTQHTQDVLQKAGAVETDLINIETSERGYAITGKETYLEPLTLGTRSLQANYDTLKVLTADNPKQQAALSEFHDGYQRWLNSEVNPLIALRRKVNDGSGPLQAVIDFIGSGSGKNQMDVLRDDLSRITQAELTLLRERQTNLTNLMAVVKDLIVFGGAAGVLIGVGVSLLAALNIKRPLAEAVRYAEKVRAGDFSARLTQSRNDEIGALLSALESMVGRIGNYTAKLKEQSALLDLAHDAIFVRDMEGRIVFWNKGAEQTYGWPEDEALGRVPVDLLQAQYPEPLEDIIRTLIASGRWEGELLHVTRSGKPITVAGRWAVRRDSDGNPSGFLEINRDVTEHKEADKQLHSYMKKMENSIALLKDFTFIASHDLQEPLRKISIYGDLLQNDYEGVLGEGGMQYLEKIKGASVRMRELIESLLLYSRVTTQAAPFVPVDLGTLIEEVMLDLEVPIHETDAKVEIHDLPNLQADPSQMRQLFQNLLGNALKFHWQDTQPVVKIYGHPCWNDSCQIFVEDNGIGFDEKYRDLIFQPFQRLHGKSSPYKGSGMGLAICRKIVERHNGTITAGSRKGNGSTFIITLPESQLDEPRQEMLAA